MMTAKLQRVGFVCGMVIGALVLLALMFMPGQTSSGQGLPPTPAANELGWRTYTTAAPQWRYDPASWVPLSDAVLSTSTANAQLAITFLGNGVSLHYATSSDGGTFSAQIDDHLPETLDTRSAGGAAGDAVWSKAVDPGVHTLIVTHHSGTLRLKSVAIQGDPLDARPISPTQAAATRPPQVVTPQPSGVIASPAPSSSGWTTYQDTDPRLVYGDGTWQTFPVTRANGGTLTGTADPGASLTAYFEGSSIRVVYARGPEGRAFAARIDDALRQTGDAYGRVYSYGHTLTIEGLEYGRHTLTITDNDGAIWIEAVEVQGRLLDALVSADDLVSVRALNSSQIPSYGIQALSVPDSTSETYSFNFDDIPVPDTTTAAVIDHSEDLIPTDGVPGTMYYIGNSFNYYPSGQVYTYTFPSNLAIGGVSHTPYAIHSYQITLEVEFDFGIPVRFIDYDFYWDILRQGVYSAHPVHLKLTLADSSHIPLFEGIICENAPYDSPVCFNTANWNRFEPVDHVRFVTVTLETSDPIQDVAAYTYYHVLDDFFFEVEIPIDVCTATVDESLGSVSSDMTIYTGPGEDYPATGTLTDGQTTTLLAMEPGTPNWYQIQGFDPANPDRFGWVKETVLVIDESAACQNLTMCSLTQAPLAMVMEDSALVSDPSASICQIAPPPILISKSISNAVLPVGTLNEFAITVTNHSGEIQQNITVIDALPEGLTIPSGGLLAPAGSTVTLNEPNEVVWIIDFLGIDASTELRFTVSVNTDLFADLLGQEIVNNVQIVSVGGEPAPSQFQAHASFVPVVCEGQSNDNLNIRDIPSRNGTVLGVLQLGQVAGAIAITPALDGSDMWYRVAVPKQEETGITFIFGWVAASLFTSECAVPLVDQNMQFVLLPDTAQGERLAFFVGEEGGNVFDNQQIAIVTNRRPDDPSPTPIVTLSPGTPIMVTGIHPNRQYVRITRYPDANGNLVSSDNSWVLARTYDEATYEDITLINYIPQVFSGQTIAVIPPEFVSGNSWRVEPINDRAALEAFVLSEEVLPLCTEGQVVNCLPVGGQCNTIFGCDPGYTANILNKFKDEEGGCSNGRCPGACGGWRTIAGTDAWHCGIDLVTQQDVEYDDTGARHVYTVQGGLISGYYPGDEGGYTLKTRDWAGSTAPYEIHENQFTHLDLNGRFASDPTASRQRKQLRQELVGQYLASGILVGNYAPLGWWGDVDVHVHYVQKNFWAPENSEVILPNDLAIRNYGGGDQSQYEVPPDFAGTNEVTSRYVPIHHPGYGHSSVIGQEINLNFDAANPRGALSCCGEQVNLPPGLTVALNGITVTISGSAAGSVGRYDVVITITEERADNDRRGVVRMHWTIN